MSVYGFTRGFRAISDSNYKKDVELQNTVTRLISERVVNGVFNGWMYAVPIWNIPMICNLINRVEIKYRNLDKKDYSSSYKEWCGICEDTI
jgi:hypothetical protein